MIYKTIYIILLVFIHLISYGQIDKKANKDPVKNTEIENSRPGATISNSKQKPLIKESDTNNMTNIQRSDSLKDLIRYIKHLSPIPNLQQKLGTLYTRCLSRT